ncbi:MAG: hypothetical protein SNF33_01220 [Candidatus Algichlamydia australiensis]|nr:hypothetical protein [Chlamydiales bacterium]
MKRFEVDVSLIFPNEYKKIEFEELGMSIPFQLKGYGSVKPQKLEGVDEVYFLVIEAPELDAIRKKYGLPQKKYEFHITIGVKRN